MFGRKATQIHDPEGGPPPKVAKIFAAPTLIYFCFILLGTALHTFTRAEGWDGGWPQTVLGILIGGAGIALSMWAIQQFRIADTSPDPREETTALIESGPFRFTRNPLYLAMTLMQVGLGLAIDRPLIAWLAIPAFLLIWFGVVEGEERYLKEVFGERYADYRKRVRRWI